MPLLAAAQLVPGPERQLAAPEPELHARAVDVDIAAGGGPMLAVWSDRRTDRGSDVYAARLDRNGVLLDRTNIPLSVTAGIDESNPLVEFDGTNYLVVWYDGTNTVGAEVSLDGAIVRQPRVITAGRPITLIRGTRDIAIASTDATGTTIGVIRPGVVFQEAARVRSTQQVAIARMDGGYVVFFTETVQNRGVVRGMRVDSRGRVETLNRGTLGSFTPDLDLALANVAGRPVLVAAARDRFVVARVETDGAITPVTTIETAAPRVALEVIPWGTDYDVLAIISGTPRVLRYVNDVLIEEDQPLTGPAGAGAAAVTASRLFTVWQIDGAVRGRFAFDDAQPRVDIAYSVANQQMPALATDGTHVLAIWTDDVTETRDRISARVVARDGTPLSVAPRTIATRHAPPMLSRPAIVFSGGRYVVAYVDTTKGIDKPAELIVRSVDRSGVASGDVRVTLTAHPLYGPALAAGPSDALLVWSRSDPNPRVHAAFVSDPQNHIEVRELLYEPAVVYANDSYLIVGGTATGSIRGVRLSAGGVVGETVFETIGTADTKPAIATSAAEQLVVFRRGTAIWGRLVGTAFEFTIAESGDHPRVTWDGTAFVVAWQNAGDAFIARVLTNGTAEAPVVLSATALEDAFPAVLGLGGGSSLAAYQRAVPELQNVHRVFTRPVETQTTDPPKPAKRRSVR